ncbi:MAG: nitrogen regulation protein NR(II) [Gammaproteobacteria bacterium]|nr:nitrogen regulation protein NR(II) [Gammaproteobacteria bacterium]MDH5801143.1 nitrogen regulation protein NR(II) [Gammaproteobacteria bacterium]
MDNQKVRMYQLIADNLGHGLLLLDHELQVRYMNPAAEMLFEISAKRALSTPMQELAPGNGALVHRIRSVLDDSHPFSEHNVELSTGGFKSVLVDCHVCPVVDAGQQLVLVELQATERNLRIAREESQFSQNNTIRALIRGMAHEVKNPLGGIRGAAQLLERELHDASLKEYTNIIINEADRLRNLVDRLLGPSSAPNIEILNIHEITEHVRQIVEVATPPKVRIYKDYDPSIPEFKADRDQLIQAVLNIVRNALQAIGEEGCISLRTRSLRQFTIGHTRHKLVCQLDIVDNGPGVPEHMMESIFFPMITGRADGTGLGLSIAQSLIQQIGGIILCQSKPGNTVFSILLPITT